MTIHHDAAPSQQQQQQQPQSTLNYGGLLLVLYIPSLGGFIFGYDIGAMSYVLSIQHSDFTPTTVWWYHLSSFWQGLIVSCIWLGALLGSHYVCFHARDTIGRRDLLRISAWFFACGDCLTVLSGTVLSSTHAGVGMYLWMTARLIFGIGVGLVMLAAPTYMAEMCPAFIRGAVVSIKEVVIVFGMVVGYGIGYTCLTLWTILTSPGFDTSGTVSHWSSWTNVYLFRLVTATLPMVVLSYCIPMSMRYLILKGRIEEAQQSMAYIYQTGVQEEFQQLLESLVDSSSATTSTTTTTNQQQHNTMTMTETLTAIVVSHPKAFCASLGLVVFQQLSAKPSLEGLSALIFAAAGTSTSSSLYMSLYMMANSIVSVFFVDRLGRKVLLQISNILMAVGLLSMAIVFFVNTTTTTFPPLAGQVVYWSMFLYVGAYEVGYGPVSWVVISEVFPLSIRGSATAFMVEINFLINFLVQFLVGLSLQKTGWAPIFLVFGLSVVLAVWFVHVYVPETKGLTLEEIEQEFENSTRSGDEGENDGEDWTGRTEQTKLLV